MQHIIDHFQFKCDLLGVVGAISGTHILLAEKPSRYDTTLPTDFLLCSEGVQLNGPSSCL